MGQRNVRVVIGQGDLDRQGYLRTVLEDDGFDVVGEAASTSPLARLLTDERPDVVVLDDAIGVAAVQIAAEIVPSAKIVVVWPAAVMPIAGAIRVDPSEVLQNLAATVAVASGIAALGMERPEWIERVRKDPSTLRELLAARGGVPTRPSVTELQRRGHRLHPTPGAPRRSARPRPKPADEPSDADRRAIVTPLPLPAAAATASGAQDASWNRRLGVIALGGAAVAGALMVALAFSNRTTTITVAEPFVPPIVQPSEPPQQPSGGNGGPTDGSDDVPTGNGGAQQGTTGGADPSVTGNSTTAGGTDPGGLGGSLIPPSGTGGGGDGSGDTRGGADGSGDTRSGADGGGDTGGGDGETSGGPSGNPDGPRPDHVPGTHGNGGEHEDGDDVGPHRPEGPGNSASHNPHGEPPGWQHRNDHADHPSNAGGNSSNANAHRSHRGRSPAAQANRHAHKQ